MKFDVRYIHDNFSEEFYVDCCCHVRYMSLDMHAAANVIVTTMKKDE